MSRPSARSQLPLRVLKLGGSLFDLPDLGSRVWNWLVRQPPAVTVVVAGGGECAEAIRRWDEVHELGDAFCHEQCGHILSVTARLAWRLLAGDGRTANWARALSDVRDVAKSHDGAIDRAPVVVLDAGPFLLHEEPQAAGDVLPKNWDVTSDSIAARAAILLDAHELVLGKSAHESPAGPGSERHDWTQLAQVGFVDRHFPQVAPFVRNIRVVNFRATGDDRD